MDRRCWLCGKNGSGDRLEKHHIFPGPFRDKSEKYGLYVWLCGDSCHRNGMGSAHRSRDVAEKLKRYGQKKAMEDLGWTTEQFIAEFGKNYLGDQDE